MFEQREEKEESFKKNMVEIGWVFLTSHIEYYQIMPV